VFVVCVFSLNVRVCVCCMFVEGACLRFWDCLILKQLLVVNLTTHEDACTFAANPMSPKGFTTETHLKLYEANVTKIREGQRLPASVQPSMLSRLRIHCENHTQFELIIAALNVTLRTPSIACSKKTNYSLTFKFRIPTDVRLAHPCRL